MASELYTPYEQKVTAARAVIESDMTKSAAMAEFKIMSQAPLKRRCKLYRPGCAEALKPKPKGTPSDGRYLKALNCIRNVYRLFG